MAHRITVALHGRRDVLSVLVEIAIPQPQQKNTRMRMPTTKHDLSEIFVGCQE